MFKEFARLCSIKVLVQNFYLRPLLGNTFCGFNFDNFANQLIMKPHDGCKFWKLQLFCICNIVSLINCKYLKLNSQFLVASNLSTIRYHPKMMEHNFVDFQTPPSHNVSVLDVGHKGGDPSWVLLEQLMLLSVHLKHL